MIKVFNPEHCPIRAFFFAAPLTKIVHIYLDKAQKTTSRVAGFIECRQNPSNSCAIQESKHLFNVLKQKRIISDGRIKSTN